VLILYRPRSVGRRPITRLCLLAAAVAIVAVAAGCGGGGGSSSSSAAGGETTSAEGGASGKTSRAKGESSSGKTAPTGSLSKSEFVKQANAICEEGKKEGLGKMAAYVKKHKGGSQAPNVELLGEALKTVFIPTIQNQVDEVRALGAPSGDESRVEDFLTALEEDVEAAEASSGSGANFAKAFKDSAELAHEYGLDGCAYG
jgi:hypothetical protein